MANLCKSIYSASRFVNKFVVTRYACATTRRWNHSNAPEHSQLKWSYAHCASTDPLLGITLGHLLRQNAKEWKDVEAIVDVAQNVRLTFQDVDAEVDKLAAGLVALNLQKGDRIGIWGPNTFQWYLSFLAAARAGLIGVTINPANQSPEVKYSIDKVGMKAIIIHDTFKVQDYYGLLSKVAPEIPQQTSVGKLKSAGLPSLTTIITMAKEAKPGTVTFDDVLQLGDSAARQQLAKIEEDIDFDHPCTIQFTSGTTGQPKAATLSHHNLVNNAYYLRKRADYRLKKERVCVSVPFFHCFGNVGGIIVGVHAGSTIVLPSTGYDPQASVKAVVDERCTVLYGTPTMQVDYLKVAEAEKRPVSDFSSLRFIITGGATCPADVQKQLKATFNPSDVISIYGMTETSPVSLQRKPGDDSEKHIKTVGPPAEHTEVKIVDKDDVIVPVNTVGELCVRGYSTMIGYWNDAEKTREIMKEDRWLHTGDLFIMDEEGYCEIVGRLKEMILRGGENIYPKEIEELLHTHPDIAEAHVFGIPDQRLGEEVCAWIRIKAESKPITPDDVRDYCKEKLAHYKIPRHIHFTQQFPITTSGKVQKFKLQELSRDIFKL